MKKNDMQMSKSKGFYVAIALCVVGVVVASLAAVSGIMDTQNEKNSQTKTKGEEQAWGLDDFVSDPVEQKQKQPILPSTSSPSQNGELSSASQSSSQGTQNAQVPSQNVQTSQCVRPVAGTVLQSFSGEELVFNETMQDWRTHNGTDYAAEKDTPVLCIMSGTVSEVKEDAVWGHVLTVKSDDYQISYMGLDDIKIEKDANIVAGEQIGKIGENYAEVA
ncbi:MAG: M23 family metallopeptidase, partial [Oscillospiraceae bacterium]